MNIQDCHKPTRWFSLGAMCVGAFGMFYCLPIILLEPVDQGKVVGLPFLSAAILFAAGLGCLTYIYESSRRASLGNG